MLEGFDEPESAFEMEAGVIQPSASLATNFLLPYSGKWHVTKAPNIRFSTVFSADARALLEELGMVVNVAQGRGRENWTSACV